MNKNYASLALLLMGTPAMALAQTGSWSAPVSLSTGGQGWESAAAMDALGNALALWDERTTQDQLWSRFQPVGGTWGTVAPVSAPLQTVSVLPAIHMTANGLATAVWTDSTGIWTADRLATGAWNPPQLLASGAAAPFFVMNSRGDAAVAWTMGGPGVDKNPNSVEAALRPAGQSWTAPQTLASGVFVIADHLAIGENGNAIVTWETYKQFCQNDICITYDFKLHTSRNNGAAWAPTGVLLGPNHESHIAHVALDAGGRAMLVALNGSGVYISATQAATGNSWSAFKKAVFFNGISMVSNVVSDDAGNVTMVYETIGLSTSQAFSIDGSITGNTWSAPVALSGSDMNVSQIYFAVAPNGRSVAIWLSSSGTPEVHAAVRTSSTAPWSTPVAVSTAGPSEISPEAAAVSSSGGAVIIYSGYNQAAVHTEYVSNYTP